MANDFIKFNPNKNNQLTQEEYNTNTDRMNGIGSGTIADSKLHNFLFNQISTMVSELGNFISNQGYDAKNDVNLQDNLANAIKSFIYSSLTATQNSGGGVLSWRINQRYRNNSFVCLGKQYGNLIFQYGTVQSETGDMRIALPISFKNNILGVWATDQGSGCYATGAFSKIGIPTGFDLYSKALDTQVMTKSTTSWLCIGY